ncbi:GntR family transcriptional regulator [Caballeronia catudaia]|uniref:GntR family transcriptional regulator n=1 Tax=Caballeronia catudaia TaxID=1777136 RepID=A0A158CL13_9BURK|nr:GntR family transcriptional regulator [Caballeronia catudaia]
MERTLCDELGVSRTVVREVLRHLETEGLVESVARQGPLVARLDPTQVAEIYELRGLLEANAARACAEKVTSPKFWPRRKPSTMRCSYVEYVGRFGIP